MLDAADKLSPKVVGAFNDGGDGEALSVWGDGAFLYVSDNTDGVEVLDVRDPTAPREVAQYDRNETTHGLVVGKEYIYATIGGGVRGWGLVVLEFEENGQ